MDRNHVSLTVNKWLKLNTVKPTFLASDNKKVKVDTVNGWIYATEDATSFVANRDGQFTIIGDGESLDGTIVSWTANASYLELVDTYPNYNIALDTDGSILAVLGMELYRSTDGLETVTKIGDLPVEIDLSNMTKPPILVTPYGYFIRGTNTIYKSLDLVTWNLSFTPEKSALYHMFDYYFDETNERVYVYTGDYSSDPTHRHKVYRGTIESNGTEFWETVWEPYSQDDYTADPINSVPAIRHIHVTTVDKSNGDIWIGAGDDNHECYILVSHDNGDTWQFVGTGSQHWRTLSIWFTDTHVYWNQDSGAVAQSIWRIRRENLPFQTLENDLKEEVEPLRQGSHWYHCWVKESDGRDVVIMSQSAEGQHRDWLGRVYLIRERNNGENVDIEELYAVPSSTPDVYVPHPRLDPNFQDPNGFIYLRASDTANDGVWKMRLVKGLLRPKYLWKDPHTFVGPVF